MPDFTPNTAENSEADDSRNIFLREASGAFCLFLTNALIFFSPALLSFGKIVIGHKESDVWKHLWGAWWMGTELIQGKYPRWTNLQNYPEGGSLYIIDPVNALIASALSWICGLVEAYNITLLLQVLAASMAAWLLARRLTGSYKAALIAGTAYGLSPFMLTSGIVSGIAETSNLAWLPLALYGLLEGLSGKSNRNIIIIGGIGMAMSAIGSWYYGMTTGLVIIIITIWTIASGKVPVPEQPSPKWGAPLISCFIAGILIIPSAFIFAQSLEGTDSLLGKVDITERQKSSSIEFLHKYGNFKNNAELAGFILPGKSHISIADDVDKRFKTVYIGIIVLFLALYGVKKEKRWSWCWLISGAAMAMLSAGPYLNLYGEYALKKPYNPVFMLAYYTIPGFRLAVITDRLSIAVQLCFAVLAAAGLKHLLPKGTKGTVVSVLCCFAVIAEIIYVSPVPWPLPVSSTVMPEHVITLKNKKDKVGLIQIPLNRQLMTLQPGEFYYWQTCHQMPMPTSLTTRFPSEMMANRLIGTLYLCEDKKYKDPPPAILLAPGLRSLQEDKFGWINVNLDMIHPEGQVKIEKILTELLGKPKRFDDHTLLYDLNSPKALSYKHIAPQPKILDKNISSTR